MKNDEIRSESFQTSDLPLATTLVSLGFPLKRLDCANPSRVVFTFTSTEKLDVAVAQFWLGRISVEPKLFWNTQRDLKSRIRNQY